MIDKLQSIVRKYSDDESITLTADMALLTDLGLNSFELVQLICEIEDEFNIEIPDRAISSLKTVQNVVDYIGEGK